MRKINCIKYFNFNRFAGILTAAVLSVPACSYDSGMIITGNGAEKSGYIRFDECYDGYDESYKQPVVEFKKSKLSDWERINVKDLKRIHKGLKTFLVIDLKKIEGEREADIKIPASVILSGKISVYRYCSARYMNTMLSSDRMDINKYIISVTGMEQFYSIPQSPDEFRNFAARHFSSCHVLVKEVMEKKFTKKINNPRPGYLSEYELVDENDILDSVKKYNECGTSVPE